LIAPGHRLGGIGILQVLRRIVISPADTNQVCAGKCFGVASR